VFFVTNKTDSNSPLTRLIFPRQLTSQTNKFGGIIILTLLHKYTKFVQNVFICCLVPVWLRHHYTSKIKICIPKDTVKKCKTAAEKKEIIVTICKQSTVT